MPCGTCYKKLRSYGYALLERTMGELHFGRFFFFMELSNPVKNVVCDLVAFRYNLVAMHRVALANIPTVCFVPRCCSCG